MSEIILGESNEAYHKSEAISHSKLLDFIKCPLLYKKKHIDKTIERKETAAMKLGSAIHTFALEGLDKFVAEYSVLKDDYNGRTNEGKAAMKSIVDAGKIPLTRDEYETVICAAMEARNLLPESFKAEVVFRHELPGFKIQSRLDAWCPDETDSGTIYDLKSCNSMESFEYNFWEFGYFRQAAFYQSVVREVLAVQNECKVEDVPYPAFKFVAVTTEQPFIAEVFTVPDEAIALGHLQIEKALRELSECLKSNEWRGGRKGIQTIDCPVWRIQKIKRELESC